MKKLFTKAALLLAAALPIIGTSCDDGNDAPKISELAGNYVPTSFELSNGSEFGTTNKVYFAIIPTYTVEKEKLPEVELGGFGSTRVDGMVDLFSPILSEIIRNAWVGLELHADGTLSASYHETTSSGDIMADMMGGLQYSKTVSYFPGEGTGALLPQDALLYSTDERARKITLSIGKVALEGVMDGICETIDALLANYPLPIVASKNAYSLSLPYAIDSEGVVKIYLDRDLIKPFVPVIGMLLASQEAGLGGIDVADMFTKLIDYTSALEIAVFLKRV